MKPWWGILFSILVGLLGSGVIILATSRPRGEPVSLSPPPAPQALVIHVSGAVVQPGLYSLPPGSRVNDAIQAAGGLTSGASQSGLNLAAPLQDGQLVRVLSSAAGPVDVSQDSQSNPAGSVSVATGVRININTAGQEELESLPGIGSVLAQRIIKYRNAYGLFQTVEDINVIYGLSPETYAMIKDLITVEPETIPVP